MGIFDVFKRKNSDEQFKESEQRSDEPNSVDTSEQNLLNNGDSSSTNKSLSAELPIDEIYKYLQFDFESRGYEDALSNPDISYRDMNKKLIVSNLKVIFKQTKQTYTDNLNRTDFHINSRSQAGLVDIVELLKNQKSMLTEHLKEVIKMEEDLEKEEDYMIGMLLSYERGFLRGLAALSLETLNIKR